MECIEENRKEYKTLKSRESHQIKNRVPILKVICRVAFKPLKYSQRHVACSLPLQTYKLKIL